MTEQYTYIFRSNGFYLGFIVSGNLYSRDGIYLGWLEGNFVWDKSGRFKGILTKINENHYIVFNQFTMPPVVRPAKPNAPQVTPPTPLANIASVTLPIQFSDAFE